VGDSSDDDWDDDDVDGVVGRNTSASAASLSAFKAGQGDGNENDADIIVTEVKGKFALVDYPHTRENCVATKPSFGTEKHCNNCYCMVCDTLVGECEEWARHCKAVYADPTWRAERAAKKARNVLLATAAAVPGDGGSSAAASAACTDLDSLHEAGPAGARCHYRRRKHKTPAKGGKFCSCTACYSAHEAAMMPFSCEALLKAVERVYPEEAACPAGLHVPSLRHYQKQTLAFMLANERAPASSSTVGSVKGTWRMLYNSGSGWGSFERRPTSTTVKMPIRGGWVCDEVGMGKTMCCIGVVLANPCADASTAADIVAFGKWKARKDDIDQTIGSKAVDCLDRFSALAESDTMYSEMRAARRPFFEMYKAVMESGYEAEFGSPRSFTERDIEVGFCYRFMPKEAQERMKNAVTAVRDAHNLAIQKAKTAAIVANDAVAAAYAKLPTRPSIKLKATVVIAPPTLLGQWRDEIAKFAPSLTVYALHKSTSVADWKAFTSDPNTAARSADVILISNRGSGGLVNRYGEWRNEFMGDECFRFHRIIVDEAHLGITAATKLGFQAPLRWAVTGTPASKSAGDLTKVAKWLGHSELAMALESPECAKPKVRNEIYAATFGPLKSLMIRHTKAMQIAGADALKLPDMESTTVWLDMSAGELAYYISARERVCRTDLYALPRRGLSLDYRGHTIGQVEFALARGDCNVRNACFGATQSKMEALAASLAQLQKSEPAFQVIVFTQSREAHKMLVAMVKGLGIKTLELSSTTQMSKRHDAIRAFQETGERVARVLVATIRQGSCGCTLTAATRVYLMEPCLDPAHEVQAAGRIHRIGQTKECMVTRFCFRNSYEEAVTELHAQFRANTVAIENQKLPPAAVKLLTSK
jgi:hypothetical protein